MDCFYGLLLAVFLAGFFNTLLDIFGFSVVFKYPLKSKVYCIGSDNIIYHCEVVGCGYHEDDESYGCREFCYHFWSLDNDDIGWAYTESEVRTEVFWTHRGAEKALKKRSKSDD